MARPGECALRPESGVAAIDGRFLAENDEPWLALDGPCPIGWAGRFVEITYRASLLDEPARPVFRFRLRDGLVTDRIGPAPIEGAGLWIGRVPRDTTRLCVSPTNRAGLFGFVIEKIRVLAWASVVARGLALRPRAVRSALLTRLIGWKQESDVNLAWAISAEPLETYARWRERRARPPDGEGLDRPRFDWAEAEPIRFLVVGDDNGLVGTTLASLLAQTFPHWVALLPAGATDEVSRDPRIETCRPENLHRRLQTGAGAGLVCRLQAGDRLAPYAAAYVAEQVHRCPDVRLFYADAVTEAATGGRFPRLQPGFSPRLQAVCAYIAPPLFIRGADLWSETALDAFVATGAIPVRPGLTPAQVKPLRRVLLETPAAPATARPGAPAATAIPPVRPDARAAIIIPTRDHPALLRRAVQSLRACRTLQAFRIVVIDNGSVEPETKALLDELAAAPDVLRLARPGPFNFSALCNEAAAASQADVLVFLNDDTEALSDHWLDRLVAHALDPATGAVGARLTYPDGRLQHVGVLVGMGESAGHFGALEPGDAPGWVGRNHFVHEVSAVTGACLAVERAKFDAVGGFDAEHLPVELSDVDLCLKLNARGWQTIVDPQVHLMHEESVSRGGATFRRLDLYGRQREIFVARWRHVLRDDPFFHPGLSLYGTQAALG